MPFLWAKGQIMHLNNSSKLDVLHSPCTIFAKDRLRLSIIILQSYTIIIKLQNATFH